MLRCLPTLYLIKLFRRHALDHRLALRVCRRCVPDYRVVSAEVHGRVTGGVRRIPESGGHPQPAAGQTKSSEDSVIVRPILGNPTESAELHSLVAPLGRLPVDVVDLLSVDHHGLRPAANYRRRREDEG